MKLVTLSMALLAATSTASLAQGRPNDVPRQIYGKVQVIDGTTFEFINSRLVVRLAGYEAPRPDPGGDERRCDVAGRTGLARLDDPSNTGPGRQLRTDRSRQQQDPDRPLFCWQINWQRRRLPKASATPSIIAMNLMSPLISISRERPEGLVSASGRHPTWILLGSTHPRCVKRIPTDVHQSPKVAFPFPCPCPCLSSQTIRCPSRTRTEVE